MTTYLGDVTQRKVVRHFWQGLWLTFTPIHNASRTLFLILKAARCEEKYLHDSRIAS